jgi:sugar phosphate isomerase/epimerase
VHFWEMLFLQLGTRFREMVHPRLSVNALSSFNWSFDQDLALWKELEVRHAGLLISKIEPEREAKVARLRAAGIRPSTLVCSSFTLSAPQTWDRTRTTLNSALDLVAAMGGGSVYCTPGRTTGQPWRYVLDTFAEAIAPCVVHANQCGVRLGVEPTVRTDVSFVNTLRDAIDVADRTGVALVVDFGNCWMERDLREVLARAAPHTCLIQICDLVIGTSANPGPGGRVHLGEGELPLHRLLQDVLDAGYRGLFDLEVLGPAIEAEGYEPALRRGVERASNLLGELGV